MTGANRTDYHMKNVVPGRDFPLEGDNIMVADVRNAGSIFLGPYSPNAVGDYVAGPNHVLPTGGQARFASQLHTEDFRTVSSVIAYSVERLAEDASTIETIAALEGFDAHAASVRIRLEDA